MPLPTAPDQGSDTVTRTAAALADEMLNGANAADAAARVGISFRKAREILRNPDVIEYIERAANAMLDGAKAEAAATTIGLLRAQSEKVRLDAARTILGRDQAGASAPVTVVINTGG